MTDGPNADEPQVLADWPSAKESQRNVATKKSSAVRWSDFRVHRAARLQCGQRPSKKPAKEGKQP